MDIGRRHPQDTSLSAAHHSATDPLILFQGSTEQATEAEKEEENWITILSCINSLLTEWWPIKLPFNIMMFLASVLLVFAPTSFWANTTLLALINTVILLHCFAKALTYVIEYGKMIDMRDSDWRCMTTDEAAADALNHTQAQPLVNAFMVRA